MESWGVDSSLEMLKVAQSKSYNLGLRINFINSDILSLKTESRFDLIYALYGVINLFDERRTKLLFCWVREHLEQRGAFIFDFYTTSTLRLPPTSYLTAKMGEKVLIRLQYNKNNLNSKKTISKRTYLEIEGSTILRTVKSEVHFWLKSEKKLTRILTESGLQVVSSFGADQLRYSRKRLSKNEYLGLIISRKN